MTKAAKLVLCKGPTHPWSGELVPVSEMSKDSTKKGKIRNLCRKCANWKQRERRCTAQRPRDAAALYMNKANLRVNRGGGSLNLTPDILEGIMFVQGYTCPVTGRDFVLPTTQQARTFTSWDTWAASLPKRVRKCVPELVMAEGTSGWKLGNMLFIAASVEPQFTAAGGLMAYKSEVIYCVEASPPIPSIASIDKFVSIKRAQDVYDKHQRGK